MPFFTLPQRHPNPARRPHGILSALFFAVIANGLASAQQHEFSDQKQTLRIEFPNGHEPQYGFQLIRLTATNLSHRKANWEVVLREEGIQHRQRRTNSGERFEILTVPPGATVQREFMMALGSKLSPYGDWNDFEVNVVMPSGLRDSWSDRTSVDTEMDLRGAYIPTLYGQTTPQWVRETRAHFEGNGVMKPLNASTDWRAYTPYGIVILSVAEWESMPQDAKLAIGDWVRLGGNLQFVNGSGLPADAPATDTPGGKTCGLGTVYGPPSPNGRGLDYESLAVVRNMKAFPPAIEASKSGESVLTEWLREWSPDLLNKQFTIWPVILVLIVFFVMVTPVNLFVLAPSRQRHRLFRTIPVISLAACLALAAAVLMGDGFGGKGTRLVHIESRAGNENRHYISQWQSSHCGAIFGSGFTISDAAFIAPVSELGSEMNVHIEADRVECGGGWFSSRSSQSQFLQTVRSSRGRIEWTPNPDGAPTIVSTFEFPLQNLYVRDDDGGWWHAPSVQQGETITPTKVEDKKAWEQIHKSTASIPCEDPILSMAERKGHYIAFTSAPSAIRTLDSIDWNDIGIVTGQLARP